MGKDADQLMAHFSIQQKHTLTTQGHDSKVASFQSCSCVLYSQQSIYISRTSICHAWYSSQAGGRGRPACIREAPLIDFPL